MPPGQLDEGLRAALDIRARHPGTAILVLSHYVESRQAVRLLEGGGEGLGYLLKDRVGDIDELADAVRRVAAGGSVIDAQVVSQLFGRKRADDSLGRLSVRETEILGLMAEGLSNSAICGRLFISPKTLDRHIGSVFAKLDLPPGTDENRRVVAVLRYLRGEQPA
jgi:DNA-binding NarL/FixJ family response regulator